MMTVRISPAAEDYLKVIYELTRNGDLASTNQIAAQMGVTAASATGMIQKLASAEPSLLEYAKHRGAALTPQGEQLALEVIRHHRLLETFLHDKLGYSWDEVHAEADRLEHVISEELEERIANALGHPSVDPHGDPIPSRELQMPEQSSLRLANLQPGDRAFVTRISDADHALLRYLADLGLVLNSRIEVIDRSPFDGNITLEIEEGAARLVLGSRVTGQIFVEKSAE